MGTPNSTFSTTPQPTPLASKISGFLGLSNAPVPSISKPTTSSSNFTNNFGTTTGGIGYSNGQAVMSTVQPGSINLTPHPQAPTNSTVKSHTVQTNPDGTTKTTQTYGDGSGTNYSSQAEASKAYDANKNAQTNPTSNANNPANVGNTVASQIPNVGGAGAYTNPETSTLQNLQSQSQNPSQAYTQGMINYDTANQKLADYNAQLAQTDKNINAQGISLDSARGQTANVGQAAAAEEAALQGGVTNASNILSAANTQQGLQVQAGTQAGSMAQNQANRNLAGQEAVLGAVQPHPYGLTSTPYNSATGTYGGMAGTSGAGGNGSLASVGGLLQTQNMGGQVKTMQGIQAQAQTLGTNLSNLISQAGINPANMGVTTSFINGVNQWLNGQAGDPKYQNFANLISEVASKYSNILNQSGGTPTDVSTTTHNIINGLASGQSIQQVLQSLDKNATDSITALDKASKNQPSGGLNTSQTNNTNYSW